MQNDSPNKRSDIGHESVGINVRATTWWLISLVVLVVVTLGLMSWLLGRFSAANATANASKKAVTLPVTESFPRLDVNQPEELLATREMAHRLLSDYAWLDQSAGVARIPISRAMAILAADGLPNVSQPSGEGQGE